MKVEQTVTLTLTRTITLGELRDFLDSIGGWSSESKVSTTCSPYIDQRDSGAIYIEVEKVVRS